MEASTLIRTEGFLATKEPSKVLCLVFVSSLVSMLLKRQRYRQVQLASLPQLTQQD